MVGKVLTKNEKEVSYTGVVCDLVTVSIPNA